jgi:hypothetical protein
MIFILQEKKGAHRVVVRASNHDEARHIANKQVGEEGHIWTDYKLTTCRRVMMYTKPRVLCRGLR